MADTDELKSARITRDTDGPANVTAMTSFEAAIRHITGLPADTVITPPFDISAAGAVQALVSLQLASGSVVTSIKDEDDMSSDLDTALATQQSIKKYVDDNSFNITLGDARYVKKSGSTMTGVLVLSGDPTADLHAATKKYVDDEVAGGLEFAVAGPTTKAVTEATAAFIEVPGGLTSIQNISLAFNGRWLIHAFFDAKSATGTPSKAGGPVAIFHMTNGQAVVPFINTSEPPDPFGTTRWRAKTTVTGYYNVVAAPEVVTLRAGIWNDGGLGESFDVTCVSFAARLNG